MHIWYSMERSDCKWPPFSHIQTISLLQCQIQTASIQNISPDTIQDFILVFFLLLLDVHFEWTDFDFNGSNRFFSKWNLVWSMISCLVANRWKCQWNSILDEFHFHLMNLYIVFDVSFLSRSREPIAKPQNCQSFNWNMTSRTNSNSLFVPIPFSFVVRLFSCTFLTFFHLSSLIIFVSVSVVVAYEIVYLLQLSSVNVVVMSLVSRGALDCL